MWRGNDMYKKKIEKEERNKIRQTYEIRKYGRDQSLEKLEKYYLMIRQKSNMKK